MNKKIKIIRGTSNTIEITITDSKYNLYSLGTGEKILFGVKKDPNDTEYIFIHTITKGMDGIYTVEIMPEDTAGIDCGKYFFDVGLQSGENYFNVIAPSLFEIVPNITKWGDG